MLPMPHRMPKALTTPSRRGFLKLSAGAGAGLVIGLKLPALANPGTGARAATGDGAFNPFVRIAPDDTVTVIIKHLDKGQGSATGLATLVAEELDARPDQVQVEYAPADTPVYKNLAFGVMGTGGSTAMANSFMQYREAGAVARAMLKDAAVKQWGVALADLEVKDGKVMHAKSGRSASFGELAEAASALRVPTQVDLKKPEDWVYIGKGFPRVDVVNKSHGAPNTYGMDLHLDDMVVAVIQKPKMFGAKLVAVDDTAAKAVPGVLAVVPLPVGVAVFATSTWPALKARNLLEIEWDAAEAETRSTDTMLQEWAARSQQPGTVGRSDGDVGKALADAAQVIEADYTFPYLAHAPMEPIDIAIRFDGETAEIWTGSQLQTIDQAVAASVLEIPPEKVAIHTMWAGGSFGRRAIYNSHYAAEAAMLAKAWGKPQPVKLVYSREDDITGGYYRPAFAHKVKMALDKDGMPTGLYFHSVGQSIFAGTPFEPVLVHNGVDSASVEGIEDMTYAIPNVQVESTMAQSKVPVLWWRSVGHTQNAYTMETMIDRAARAAGKDPVAYRLALLKDDPRKTGVLKKAAEMANWDAGPPQGRHRGVAVHRSFNSYVAEIAEVSKNDDGTFKVEKVWCAVDCGVPINPDNIKAQMEGGIGYGLGAILRNQITMTDGIVDQANFDTYEPLRISDMPDVEVAVIASAEAPTGAGEPGTPPIGPAVANAILAATGKAYSDLPLSKHDLV
ncbi:molybdopterin cofactor-binding domain-containing protein [Marinibaculum pumilum]|uniref:Molybdopterin cofactor-binding domain-containing protein n=1 Tax=Marinibaculum pumilum TaxID=1766165 RepID=A0ABV7KUY0_9PROT